MHQQIRVVLATPSSVVDGAGAMAAVQVEVEPREIAPGTLVRLLKLLADNDYNLRMAGGKGIETGGGVFVFAIDDKGDENAAGKCKLFLEQHGYENRVEVIEPLMGDVEDTKGALHRLLMEIVSDGLLVDEVFVGTPRKGEGNKIPIHVTAIDTRTRREGQRKAPRR
jgi:hypothetical protein